MYPFDLRVSSQLQIIDYFWGALLFNVIIVTEVVINSILVCALVLVSADTADSIQLTYVLFVLNKSLSSELQVKT
jgi:hypothetical protein